MGDILDAERRRRMIWKIQPVNGGWWLFIEGTPTGLWWHVWGTSENRWSHVFPTLEEALQRIKEREHA
jgi:hypothetical protein